MQTIAQIAQAKSEAAEFYFQTAQTATKKSHAATAGAWAEAYREMADALESDQPIAALESLKTGYIAGAYKRTRCAKRIVAEINTTLFIANKAA